MINELAIHMSHCFGMIKLGIIYLLPKYFDYNPLNIILKRPAFRAVIREKSLTLPGKSC